MGLFCAALAPGQAMLAIGRLWQADANGMAVLCRMIGDGAGLDAADGPFFSHQSQYGGVFEVMPVLVQ
jgi:hypothetical protein